MKNPNDEIRRLREAFHQAILADLRERVLSYHSIAVKHGTTVTLVYNLARANDCQRRASKAQAAQEFSQQQQENNKNKRTQSTKSETKSENPQLPM